MSIAVWRARAALAKRRQVAPKLTNPIAAAFAAHLARDLRDYLFCKLPRHTRGLNAALKPPDDDALAGVETRS